MMVIKQGISGWMVLYGRTIGTAQVIDIDGRRAWQSKRELVAALKAKGLQVDSKTGEVTSA